jgi:hypothetical protein
MTHLETIEQALLALEDLGMKHYENTGEVLYKQTFEALRQVREQIEQTAPVAIVDSTITGHIDWLCTFFPKQGTKLYTSPQPRQPLTRKQIDEMADDGVFLGNIYEITRAIESKLKEKA